MTQGSYTPSPQLQQARRSQLYLMIAAAISRPAEGVEAEWLYWLGHKSRFSRAEVESAIDALLKEGHIGWLNPQRLASALVCETLKLNFNGDEARAFRNWYDNH